MEEEKIEKENSTNLEEEETSETSKKEETSVEEQETSKKPEKTSAEIEEANKKLYARTKKAEEEAKSVKEELEKVKKSSVKTDTSDPLGLAKTVSALKDYSPEELDDIALISKAKEIPLEEAAQSEEAKVLVTARRKKVAKDKKTPEPSSTFMAGKSLKDIKKMSDEEFEEYEKSYSNKQRGGME